MGRSVSSFRKLHKTHTHTHTVNDSSHESNDHLPSLREFLQFLREAIVFGKLWRRSIHHSVELLKNGIPAPIRKMTQTQLQLQLAPHTSCANKRGYTTHSTVLLIILALITLDMKTHKHLICSDYISLLKCQ